MDELKVSKKVKYRPTGGQSVFYRFFTEIIYGAGCINDMAEKISVIADCLDKGNKDISSAYDNFFEQFDYQDQLVCALKEDPSLIKTFVEETFTYMKEIAELNPVEACVDDVEKIFTSSI